METLGTRNRESCLYPENLSDSRGASAVLFLLSLCPPKIGLPPEPCILLNKRSKLVRQAGDLCFPGGGIVPHVDSIGARLLGLPFFPLGRWPHWKEWRRLRRKESTRLALLLATGLRESLEEMRLNPFGVEFLGPMPAQTLLSFQRVIYPLMVRIRNQKRFFTNREVEKVVSIPIKDLLEPEKYIRYRMHFESSQNGNNETLRDFPGFFHDDGEDREVLWGATYHIVVTFLEIVFGFSPPEITFSNIIEGCRGENYF
ncbi:MAG: hypothetical protein WA974_07880 [Thermodesulfobacteriota bacterium]